MSADAMIDRARNSTRTRRLVVCVSALLAAACACGPNAPLPADPGATRAPTSVTFIGTRSESNLGAEAAAALAWLRSVTEVRTTFAQLDDLASVRLDPSSVLWWHYSEQTALPSAALDPSILAAVRAHVDDGGALLLTLLAAPWVTALGLESSAPDVVAEVPGTEWVRWDDNDDRVLSGFQTYRGHPLLRRFWGGAYTSYVTKSRRYATAHWSTDRWPVEGAVVAVGKRYIGIDSGRKVIVEYRPEANRTGGHVLTIGEGMYFADAGNRNRRHLELFTIDALTYVAGKLPPAPPGATLATEGAVAVAARAAMSDRAGAAPAPAPGGASPNPAPEITDGLPEVLSATTHWTPVDTAIEWLDVAAGDAVVANTSAAVIDAISAARSGPALERAVAAGTPFDLATPRTLVVGRHGGRVDDVWGMPVRIARDLRFGIDRGDRVDWLDELPNPAFVARPEGVEFRYDLQGATLTLHLAALRGSTGVVAVFGFDGDTPITLRARWNADHGVVWPRGERHLGALQVGWDRGAPAAMWRDPTGTMTAHAGFGVQPVRARVEERDLLAEPTTEASDASAPAPAELSSALFEVDTVLDRDVAHAVFAMAASYDETSSSRETYAGVVANPASVWTTNANYASQLLASTLSIATPDPTFNEAFRWAKLGLDAFRVTTPGMGTGLVAGYAASRRADTDSWAAENDFLRRPGYAWYFGRDAAWTAFAADAYGGLDLTRAALRFLARYQDVDGKILHEMSPGWALHYDAADSTPLFLLALDHHVRATGDRDLLRELWPAVRRAMRYLDATDTDGDGLIENTDVGHGWIEGGALYGAHTTFYLAGLWAGTLEAVERMARWMADDELVQAVAPRVSETRRIVNEDFWDPQARFFFYGKNADGTFKAARTILPAVPMYFGLLDGARVRPLLDLFASAEITSDWGARMVERSHPGYRPDGYHDGSVWPLYTGWTSLAAFRNGKPWTGYLHLTQNLRLVRAGSLGHVPEVLDGDVFRPAGVTEHQAWSHAMAVLPAVEGMLGFRPDATRDAIALFPHLPAGWSEIVAQPLRVGQETFKLTIRRGSETSGFAIERLGGSAPIGFDLSMPFPRAVLVNLDRDATTGVVLRGDEAIIDRLDEKQIRVQVTLTEPIAEVVFRHSPFPEVLPNAAVPAPGTPSSGLRIIESRFVDRSLHIRLEGLVGQRYSLALQSPWEVARVSGGRSARIISGGPGRVELDVEVPDAGEGYRRADITVEFRR